MALRDKVGVHVILYGLKKEYYGVGKIGNDLRPKIPGL